MDQPNAPDPNSKKLSGNPDPNAFVESTTAPLKAVRLRTDGPVEAIANLVMNYDPSTGQFACPKFINTTTGIAECDRCITEIRTTGAALVTAAGVTNIFPPGTGYAARIRMIDIVIDGATTTAAGSLLTLYDVTLTTAWTILESFPVAAPGGMIKHTIVIPGNGYKFPKNSIVGINLSAALTAGGISVTFYGNKE